MRKSKTLDRQYFEGLYQGDQDPWKFATSAYERAKYDDTLAALGHQRAARGLEVGCSIGVLTERLAAHCDELVATDISQTALQQARRRCAGLANIDFRLASAPAAQVEGAFDLVVLSEVVYYWDDDDIAAFAAALKRSVRAQGRILLVHWLGETDYPKSADDAVLRLATDLEDRFAVERSDRRAEYRLDLWRWTGGA
jgi:cyclopropane fatty-acyl-phospholipid synthase-like methyltransferase